MSQVNITSDAGNEAQTDLSEGGDSVSKVSSTPDAKKKAGEQLAKTEGEVVFILRVLVIVVLVCSAIGVSMGVYQYTSNQEEDEFQNKFDSDATKVLDS